MEEELRQKIAIGTSKALRSKRDSGLHIGRPAKFMFKEDIEKSPLGRYDERVTLIKTEDEIYAYARKGFSLYYVAKEIGIAYNVLTLEMKIAGPNHPRCKGLKDRFTEYNNILRGVNADS